MRVTVPHGTTRQQARTKVRRLLNNLAEKHAGLVSDIEQSWDEDLLHFGFRARGVKAQGVLEVTDDEVIVEGHLPLLARPFESRIKSAIEQEARNLFRKT